MNRTYLFGMRWVSRCSALPCWAMIPAQSRRLLRSGSSRAGLRHLSRQLAVLGITAAQGPNLPSEHL